MTIERMKIDTAKMIVKIITQRSSNFSYGRRAKSLRQDSHGGQDFSNIVQHATIMKKIKNTETMAMYGVMSCMINELS